MTTRPERLTSMRITGWPFCTFQPMVLAAPLSTRVVARLSTCRAYRFTAPWAPAMTTLSASMLVWTPPVAASDARIRP